MDHLGSVRAVVPQNGTVVEARDYYPFGLTMPGRVWGGEQTREGFTGHELDAETGNYYAGARYYVPSLGRWTVVDPLADSFPAWSPYNYVMNSPVGLVDPDGRAPACDPPASCNPWSPVMSFGEYSFNRIGESAQRVGDTVEAGARYAFSRLTGAEDAMTAPGRYVEGRGTASEGFRTLREGSIREGLDGMATGYQQRSDAVGDGAGFVENVTFLPALTGNPKAIATHAVASFTSTAADFTGAALEVVRWRTGSGSGNEVLRRFGFATGNALLPVRFSPNSETGQAGVSIILDEADRLTAP